jgi:hypothetical protein
MQAQVEEAQAALARKHLQQQELIDKAEKAEAEIIELEKGYAEASLEVESLKEEVKCEAGKRAVVESQLTKTQVELKKTSAILLATQRTEESLTLEATALLNTLKESIGDGDGLHNILQENRKCDVERKMATLKFHSNSIQILEKTIDSLHTLSKEADTHHSLIKNSVEKGREIQCSFLAKSGNLLEEITENVQSFSNSLRATIADEGGILPVFKDTVLSIQTSLNDVSKTVTDGEESLFSSLQSSREQLEEDGNRLRELQGVHESISEESLTTWKTSVSTTKERISRMISTANEALATARAARAERRVALASHVSWHVSESNSVSTKIQVAAKDQSETVGKALDIFATEMNHHQIMANTLDDQLSLVGEKGKSHIKDVSKQHAALSAQREMITAAHEWRQQMRAEITRTVMVGVQDILRTQLDNLAKEEGARMESISISNSELVENATELGESTQNIVQHVEKSNSVLAEEAMTIRKNDTEAKNVMELANRTLNNIAAASTSQQKSTFSFAATAVEHMEHLSKLDEEAEDIEERLNSDEEECSAHIVKINGQTKNNFIHLGESGTNMASYSSDTIVFNSSAALGRLEKPRKEFIEKFRCGVTHITDCLSSRQVEMENLAKKQSEAASNLRTAVESKQNLFTNDLATSHKAHIDAHKENIDSHMSDYRDAATSQLSGCTSKAKKVHDDISGFTTNIIEMDEAVPPAPERTILLYNERLSKTQHVQETILQGLNLKVDDEMLGATESVRNPSLSSPVLQEVSMNQDSSRTMEQEYLLGEEKSLAKSIRARQVTIPSESRKKARVASTSGLDVKR